MGKVIDLDQERGPGRVRTPARRPNRRRQARTQAYNAALEEFTGSDPVVRAATAASSVEALYEARNSVAREAASLLWERLHAVPASREAARTSSRRIAALSAVAGLTVAIHRANPGQPSPERLGRVLAALHAEVEEAARNLFDSATAQRFLDELARRLPEDLLRLELQ